MNIMLLIAGLLSVLIGIAHSVLGEKLLLGPIFKRGELPALLGSRAFARRTLRFAWHLTTVLLWGVGATVVFLSLSPLTPQSSGVGQLLAITFGASSLLSLIGARAKHFSWWVFLIIAILLWFGVA